jgi:hypothetical protein
MVSYIIGTYTKMEHVNFSKILFCEKIFIIFLTYVRLI